MCHTVTPVCFRCGHALLKQNLRGLRGRAFKNLDLHYTNLQKVIFSDYLHLVANLCGHNAARAGFSSSPGRRWIAEISR